MWDEWGDVLEGEKPAPQMEDPNIDADDADGQLERGELQEEEPVHAKLRTEPSPPEQVQSI